MARKAGYKQLYAEITPQNFAALDKAVAAKYGGAAGMRAQFIRDAVADAVRAQGIEWENEIQSYGVWGEDESGNSEPVNP